jgi:hypothetical protein
LLYNFTVMSGSSDVVPSDKYGTDLVPVPSDMRSTVVVPCDKYSAGDDVYDDYDDVYGDYDDVYGDDDAAAFFVSAHVSTIWILLQPQVLLIFAH